MLAFTAVLAEKTESASDAEPAKIQCPKSTVMLPEPVEDEAEVNPVNSRVCGVAKFVILKSELNAFAVDKLSTVKVACVLALLVPNFEVSDKVVIEFLNVLSELTTSARLDICVFFSSIFLLILFLTGAVSACTKLSTICEVFKPEPF